MNLLTVLVEREAKRRSLHRKYVERSQISARPMSCKSLQACALTEQTVRSANSHVRSVNRRFGLQTGLAN